MLREIGLGSWGQCASEISEVEATHELDSNEEASSTEMSDAIGRHTANARLIFLANPEIALLIHRKAFDIQAVGIAAHGWTSNEIQENVVADLRCGQTRIGQAMDGRAIGFPERNNVDDVGHAAAGAPRMQKQFDDARRIIRPGKDLA